MNKPLGEEPQDKNASEKKKNLNPTGSRLALGQKANVQCQMLACGKKKDFGN